MRCFTTFYITHFLFRSNGFDLSVRKTENIESGTPSYFPIFPLTLLTFLIALKYI